jgi:hypothetical protein
MHVALRLLWLGTSILLCVACDAISRKGDDAGPAPVAAKEMGKPRVPPRPKPLPPAPPLPDLPILEAQEPTTKLPFGISLPRAAIECSGTVWTGNEMVAVPCAQNGILFGREAPGAKALVSARLLPANVVAMPAIVDHRFTGLEGPARNQLSSPACTAFALAGAIDHAVARWSGKAPGVSPMEIWSRYHAPSATKAIGVNLGKTVSLDQAWPFDERTAKGWLACEAGPKPPKEGCGLPPDPKRVAKTAAEPAATLTNVTYLDDPDVDDIREQLAAGQDVIVSMELPASFTPKGKPGARYVPHWAEPAPNRAHAMLLAGYVTLARATYFLIHNSWGAGWGDAGYAWIHATTLERHMREALAIDAEPFARDAARQKRSRGAYTCDPGLVPDSVRGTCTPPCGDGSPRSDGFCAVAEHCPTGLVNLTGVCVQAAPTARGSDSKSGISWACGPGGCTYDLPRTHAPDCLGSRCKASCPAPIFRIARAGDDLTCIE